MKAPVSCSVAFIFQSVWGSKMSRYLQWGRWSLSEGLRIRFLQILLDCVWEELLLSYAFSHFSPSRMKMISYGQSLNVPEDHLLEGGSPVCHTTGRRQNSKGELTLRAVSGRQLLPLSLCFLSVTKYSGFVYYASMMLCATPDPEPPANDPKS